MQETEERLFHEYFADWIELYKVGAIRKVTLQKYYMSLNWVKRLVPDLKLCDLNKVAYQKLLNDYAMTHEKQTTKDFHRQVRASILDALEEGIIEKDITRKAIIKGKEPNKKRPKFLNQEEVQALLKELSLNLDGVNWDWFILLLAKTGMRFAEALALTPDDFDFENQKVTISKTWNYKSPEGGFQPTKTVSSVRKIQLDLPTAMQFSTLIKDMQHEKPIFVSGRVFNSTVQKRLDALCDKARVSKISLHGLRHTHASLLLFAGVSTASVSRRLGHSSIATTQETYMHIIKELETQDNDKIVKFLANVS